MGNSRYKVNATGVIEDTKTGLEWLVGPGDEKWQCRR